MVDRPWLETIAATMSVKDIIAMDEHLKILLWQPEQQLLQVAKKDKSRKRGYLAP